MLAQIISSTVSGIDACLIKVEVDISSAQPSFTIVGLPDIAVTKLIERVRAAIKNCGFEFPSRRITINLTPTDIREECQYFDLPIAIGILAATNQANIEFTKNCVIVGELDLDGAVKNVSGVLSIAMNAREKKIDRLIVPAHNIKEAAIVGEVEAYPVATLTEVVQLLNKPESMLPAIFDIQEFETLDDPKYDVDFCDVKGQENAKRALEISAAGGHSFIMIGSPGSGKKMLARRIPTILPPLSLEEALESTKLYSVCGLLSSNETLITRRAFRTPHHTISNAGLTGGGTYPRPGEASLAHNGVLFLDELPRFHKDMLEVLRQPLEDGVVTIDHTQASLTYPAHFVFAAALTPCPCGYYGDRFKKCTCTPQVIQQYQQRISEQLLDMIDVHIEVPRLKSSKLMKRSIGESSTVIRQRVVEARHRQLKRFNGSHIYCNAQMKSDQINLFCNISEDAKELQHSAAIKLNLSNKSYNHILKISRTIADLAGEEQIQPSHIAEAIQYRTLDRKFEDQPALNPD